jgi:DNA-binding helix-hairpin-helix protein with protein kinase domain
MFQLEEHRAGQWQPVNEHLYRTRLRAITAARTRTAQHGTSHRVVDLSEEAAAEYVAAGSVSKSHHRYLRCGTLGELDRQATESTERCHQWLSR